MLSSRPARARAASSILALSGALLAVAVAPTGAGAATGDVTIFPTPAAAGGNGSITAGSDGNVWFTDPGTRQISKITPAGVGSIVATLPGDPADDAATTLQAAMTGSDGNVWFADGDGTIRKVTPAGDVSLVSDELPRDSVIFQMAPAADGGAWWSSINTSQVGRVSPVGSVRMYGWNDGVSPISAPFGIAAGIDGNLWVGTYASGQILRATPAGAFSEPGASGGAAKQLAAGSQPTMMALGADGKVWFNDFGGLVGSIDSSGNVRQDYGVRAGGVGMAAGPDGAMWFISTDQGDPNAEPPVAPRPTIARLTPSGQLTEFPLDPAADPNQITAGADGNMWFTDHTAHTVTRIATGAAAAVAKAPVVSGSAVPGSVLTCGGESFSTWGAAQPTKTVRWLRDGEVIAGATGRTYTSLASDEGRGIACRVSGKYAVPAVIAPATSAALTVRTTPVAEPEPSTPDPKPTPSTPTPVTPTPLPKPTGPTVATPTGTAPAAPAPSGTAKAPVVAAPKTQVLNCKFAKTRKQPRVLACITTVIDTPPAVSSKTAAGTLSRRGKSHAIKVLVGKSGLRLTSVRVLPTGEFVLKTGKKKWTVMVGASA